MKYINEKHPKDASNISVENVKADPITSDEDDTNNVIDVDYVEVKRDTHSDTP